MRRALALALLLAALCTGSAEAVQPPTPTKAQFIEAGWRINYGAGSCS